MDSNFFGKSILTEGGEAWNALHSFRANRSRNKNYTFGRQWEDIIEVDGRRMSEREYIISEGNIPLQNNLIRRIVRNVIGVFRARLVDEMQQWDKPLSSLAAANGMYELLSRSMEEFLISGMAVHKKWVGRKNGVYSVWTERVDQKKFFFNPSARDSSGKDFTLVGEIHDVSFDEFCEAFAPSREEYERTSTLFSSLDVRKLRVVEIWRRERRPRRLVHDPEAASVILLEEADWRKARHLHHLPNRWVLQEVWRYYFISPDGSIIRQGDSPYPHKSHPYVFKAYPFIDGEIQSFVGDIIDQQRYTNRLITLYDWVIRSSAKGVLLLPEGAVEPDRLQEAADQWGRFNGVIVYRPCPGNPDPRQVNATGSNVAISELLSIQLKMLEDVSGVNGALQGNVASNSVSGTLYSQQTANSISSFADIFDSFAAFMAAGQAIDLALLSACPDKEPRRASL